MTQEWEEVARNLLEEMGNPARPIDAFELARDCGFDVVEGKPGARTMMVGDCLIGVDPLISDEARRYEVACSLGRWALYRSGLEVTPEGAQYVGLALMMPAEHLVDELREAVTNDGENRSHVSVLLFRATHLIEGSEVNLERRREMVKCRNALAHGSRRAAATTNRGC